MSFFNYVIIGMIFENKKKLIIENNNTKLNYPASYFPILLSFDCHSTKNEPRNAVNSAFLGSCTLLEFNDCISVSTISCGFDSIKSTTFIHIIQAIFFYRKYLGQKLVTLLCWNQNAFPSSLSSAAFVR